ncbi:MAG: PEP-CTERM sorting domain-containing protein [Verrucomicrobia bacterium]|nr:PEP-CTERM sorting domain-containing protein [Verrucomicrobiota bacterium]
MLQKIFRAVIAMATVGMTAHAYANLIIVVDQTGANDPVSIATPRVWNFGITEAGATYFQQNGITFDSALFAAKDFSGTTYPLVFTLYSGLGGNVNGNTALLSISHPATSFNEQYGGGPGSLYTFVPKSFTTGYYSVTLTTGAPDQSNKEYFLKDGKLTLLTEVATGSYSAINSAYWLQDQSVGNATTSFNGTGSLYGGDGGSTLGVAPEPSATLALIAITGVSFGGSFLRRFRKSA